MPEWVVIVTALFGGGGVLTGLLAWRRDALRGPVEVATSQIANAVAVSEAASNWVEYQDAKMKEQEARFQLYEVRLSNQEKIVSEMQHDLAGWGGWYMDLKTRWHFHQRQEYPPPSPQLHVTIDPRTEAH